jgi:xanthine dehydrogenase accessory factor
MVPVRVKIGDVDPRATVSHCFEISEKALSIAGGVLEAILAARWGVR